MICKFNASLAMAALAFSAGCGSSSDGDGARAVRSEKAYAFVTQVMGPDGSTTYVNVVDTLDITGLDRSKGREFPGTSSAVSIDGKLFVASGEAPLITRFDVTNDTNWTEEGRIHFGAQGLASAGFFQNITANPQKAYLALNVIDRIVWNPNELAIRGKVAGDSRIQLVRDGKNVSQGYEQGVRDNRAFQPFYWASTDFLHFAPYSQIAVYDTDTDATRALLDAPCPHLHRSAKDDAGNIYFSNGSGSATQWLFDEDGPRNCIVRIKAGEEKIDPDFTVRFADVTGGLEGAAFQNYENGKGFLAVFDHRGVTVSPNASVEERLAVNQSENWQIWVMDLATRTAYPMTGIDRFSGQFFSIRIESRTFVLLPTANYAGTRVFEIMPDLTARKLFETTGWIYGMFKLR